MEAGSYRPGALASVAGRADELGRLARVFDSMVLQMKAREERLRDQVRDLRQDIEQARRDSKEFPPAVDGGNLHTGERLGQRYEVLAELGRGGMGTVYRARDIELDEEIAIKTLRPELVTDPTLLGRFKDEIRLARRLSHQNIVRTHDFGEWSGLLPDDGVRRRHHPREFLDKRGRLPFPHARRSLPSSRVPRRGARARRDPPRHQAAEPAARRRGGAEVMDFGVSRLSEGSTALTESGLVIGTPAYMPPEQLMGEASTPAATCSPSVSCCTSVTAGCRLWRPRWSRAWQNCFPRSHSRPRRSIRKCHRLSRRWWSSCWRRNRKIGYSLRPSSLSDSRRWGRRSY